MMCMETEGAMEEPKRWQNMRAHYPSAANKWAAITKSLVASASASEPDHFILLLKLIGSAFIPYRVQLDHASTQPVKRGSIEFCTAKYIVQQYLAATGGIAALNSVNSMCAVGELNMEVSSDDTQTIKETGGFVIWQMDPESWFLELMVSGNKITAGSDGKLTWTSHSSSTAPPRPLRRFFQGLDPRSTANLFLNAVCVGEKMINVEDCFILKLEASPETLKSHTTPNTELIYHTIWGYFSQRSGLLIQFEDNKLTRMKNATDGSVFYETSLESLVEDYRCVDGINIAHSGTTSASIYRYGEAIKRKWKMEETWNIQELGFNVSGLSPHYFSPPTHHNKEEEEKAQSRDDGI